MALRIMGLTGSIGMGKSTASRFLRAMGIPVHDADATVHRLLSPGGAGVAPVVRAFPQAAGRDGGVDRKALGAEVFSDRAGLERLESILHPLVRAEERRFLARCCAAGHRLAALDVPLLFETGGDGRCDAVVVLSAPAFLQEQRVLRRPGMTRKRLQAVRARQMGESEKRRRADIVVLTGLNKRHTLRALLRAVVRVRARPARRWPPKGRGHWPLERP